MPNELVNTFIIPIIRTDLIERCLDTLYANTPPNFYVIIIDQTYPGIDSNYFRNKFKNCTVVRPAKTDIHKTGNLGFAKATNMGIKLVETPYFTMCNDDVEFLNIAWWQGVVDAFHQVDAATPETPCISVTPGSIKLADWSLGRASGDDFYILPYKEKYTQKDWDFLINEEHYINEHLTIKPNSIIDGITFYCSVFRTTKFLEVGMLNEKYYPGGAEDYDYCGRAYMHNFRAVSTTKSWVLHHWSKSIRTLQEAEQVKQLIDPELSFGDHNQVWGLREDGTNFFDLWGVKCTRCEKHLRVKPGQLIASCPAHPDETYQMPEETIVPL